MDSAVPSEQGAAPLCMGFYQAWRNDLRWIGHEGDLIGFYSLFFVEPTQKLVLFVSYNSAGGGARPRPEIINQFSDRYFLGAPRKQTFLNLPRSELQQLEGTYVPTRRADSTKLRLFALLGQAPVSIGKDGAAVIDFEYAKDLRLHPIHWKPVAKDLWQEVGGQETLFAIRDEHGRIVRFAVSFPGVQMERVKALPPTPTWDKYFVLIDVLVGIAMLFSASSIFEAIRTWQGNLR